MYLPLGFIGEIGRRDRAEDGLMQDLFSHLRGTVAEGDFHEVTEQERAVVLWDITVERTLAPMTSIAEFAALKEAGECRAQECAAGGCAAE